MRTDAEKPRGETRRQTAEPEGAAGCPDGAPHMMRIEGIGLIGDFGVGRSALEARFLSPGPLPVLPASPVDTEGLLRYLPARVLRHADHFSRMALLGVFHALDEAGLAPGDLAEGGIVLVSGHGPLARSFEFLESMRTYGPQLASPLAFSLSVHNIPAAILALNLGLRIPCATLCGDEGVVIQGLLTARSWLREGRVKRVLFAAVEERSSGFERIALSFAETEPELARRLHAPHSFAQAAVCLILSECGAGRDGICVGPAEPAERDLPDEKGMPLFFSGSGASEAACARRAHCGQRAYGRLPIAQALDIALARSMLEGVFGGAAARVIRCVELAGNAPPHVVELRTA